MDTIKRVNCARCDKAFYTYETDRTYCTEACKAKHEYSKLYSHKEHKLKPPTVCRYCSERIAGRQAYCGRDCRRAHQREMATEANRLKDGPRKIGRPRPYDVLNEMEEKKLRQRVNHPWRNFKVHL